MLSDIRLRKGVGKSQGSSAIKIFRNTIMKSAEEKTQVKRVNSREHLLLQYAKHGILVCAAYNLYCTIYLACSTLITHFHSHQKYYNDNEQRLQYNSQISVSLVEIQVPTAARIISGMTRSTSCATLFINVSKQTRSDNKNAGAGILVFQLQ